MTQGTTRRFSTRQVGATWTVYNRHDLEPARVDGVLQVGLDHDGAVSIAERLNLSTLRDRLVRQDPAPIKGRSLGLVTQSEAA